MLLASHSQSYAKQSFVLVALLTAEFAMYAFTDSVFLRSVCLSICFRLLEIDSIVFGAFPSLVVLMRVFIIRSG